MSLLGRRDPGRFLRPLGLALILGACGGSGDSASGWLAGDGKPVDLALSFDAASGNAKVITPRGGSVSTTGADGTLYELQVPEGALLSDERISLIPVASVKKLPLKGGSIAAVHLKPEGLRLLKPAMLRIRARTEVPVAEQVAFAYFANGKDAHLYPLTRDRTRIELPILHFSGYGFAQAPSNDPGRIALQYAADKEARLASKLADAINKERAKPEGEPSAATEILVQHLAQYYKDVVRPLMKIAETDEQMAECALQRALSWERQMQLLGLVPVHPNPGWPELEPLRAEASVSGQKIAENYKQKFGKHFIKQCREAHDVFAASNYMSAVLGLARQSQLLGTASDEDIASISEFFAGKDPVLEEILKCLSFELEFRSVFETKTADGDTRQHYHVHAQVPITRMPITAEGFGLLGEPARAPLKYAAFSLYSRSANRLITLSGVGTRESELTVFGLSFAKTREKKKQTNCAGQDEWEEGYVADTVRVRLSPGRPVELVRVTLPGLSSVNESTGWLNFWNLFRQKEKVTHVGAADAPAFSDAEASDVYAIKLRQESPGTWRVDFEESKTNLGGFESEDSYVVLRHTPK